MNLQAQDRNAVAILNMAGDVIGAEDGGEIDLDSLSDAEVGAAVLIERWL